SVRKPCTFQRTDKRPRLAFEISGKYHENDFTIERLQVMTASQILNEPEIVRRAMDLGPDSPLADFTSTLRWDDERIHAMALYCSDGRWGESFDEFCHNHLQIPRYDRWAVPGGPAWLVASGDETGFSQAARLQLDFL